MSSINWNRFPFVRLLFPVLAAVVLFKEFALGWNVLLSVLAIGLLFQLINIPRRWQSLSIIPVYALITCFVIFIHSHRVEKTSKNLNSNKNLKVFCIKKVENASSFTRLIGKSYQADGQIKKAMLMLKGKHALMPGDYVLFDQEIKPISKPKNKEAVNFQRIYSYKYLFNQVFLNENQFLIIQSQRMSLARVFHQLGKKLASRLEHHFKNENSLSIAKAILLGQRKEMDEDLRLQFQNSGAIHVLAVSGLHIGIVFVLLKWVLGLRIFGFQIHFRFQSLLILISIWSFALLTGASPAVCRAALMFSLFAIAQLFRTSSNVFNGLAASAFVLLMIRPVILYDLGFQLSYGALLGILIFQPRLKQLWIPENPIFYWAWELALVSISAQLVVGPLCLYHFNSFPAYFIPASLLAIPICSLILYTGILALVLPSGFLQQLVFKLLEWECQWMEASVRFFSRKPMARLEWNSMQDWQLWIWFILVLPFLFCLLEWGIKKRGNVKTLPP